MSQQLKKAEDCIMRALKQIGKITPKTAEQKDAKIDIINTITEWQNTELYVLRRAFE
jgi:hypothetical protein